MTEHSTPGPRIRVGLPYASKNAISDAAAALGAPTLISTGSLYRPDRDGFQAIGRAAWATCSALDSAGFVAMLQGGYRWTVEDYVAFVVTCSGDGSMPFPWEWWSAMDYCCEQEIAGDRATVEARMAATAASLGETLEALDWWRSEGDTDTPDPLPILQGRTADDYEASAAELGKVLRSRGRPGLPALVGVGSVCRRHLHGPEGLLPVLRRLDAVLPPHVRLHLFGVKGEALEHFDQALRARVASIDSMAWDDRCRHAVREQMQAKAMELHGRPDLSLLRGGPHWVPRTTELRAQFLTDWYRKQIARVGAPVEVVAVGPAQLSLFEAVA